MEKSNNDKMKINHIYNGDCIKIMSDLIQKESIDIIYADPPYNLSGKKLDLPNNQTGGAFYKMNEDWDIYNYSEYLKFTEDWINSAIKTLKANGSIYISCTQHNVAEIIFIAKKLGLKLNNILTWYKVNAMPNITKRTFTHSTEFVCWFVKGTNWIFNYEVVKKFNPHKTKEGLNKQMRDFLDFVELPIVQGKERLKNENGKAMHPTQKPVKLIELILLASSNENSLVLDPFFGTGTTGLVALQLKRNFIGIEINKKFVDIARERIKNYVKN